MMIATLPYGPHGVDHCSGGQVSRQGDNRMTGWAFALLLDNLFAGRQQRRPCSAMNRSIDTTSAQ